MYDIILLIQLSNKNREYIRFTHPNSLIWGKLHKKIREKNPENLYYNKIMFEIKKRDDCTSPTLNFINELKS